MSQSVTVPRQKCDDSNSEGSVPPLWPNWPVCVAQTHHFRVQHFLRFGPEKASITKSVGVDGFGQPVSSPPLSSELDASFECRGSVNWDIRRPTSDFWRREQERDVRAHPSA